MATIRRATLLALLPLAISGCAQQHHINLSYPGMPDAQGRAEWASCTLYSNQYVQGAGWAVRGDLFDRVFTDCMVAKGWTAG